MTSKDSERSCPLKIPDVFAGLRFFISYTEKHGRFRGHKESLFDFGRRVGQAFTVPGICK